MYIEYMQGLSQPRLSTTDHATSFVAYTTVFALKVYHTRISDVSRMAKSKIQKFNIFL
jgi:hypothetical protein